MYGGGFEPVHTFNSTESESVPDASATSRSGDHVNVRGPVPTFLLISPATCEEPTAEPFTSISAVTADDIQELAHELSSRPLSIAAVGAVNEEMFSGLALGSVAQS